ncbi:dual specificity phosphatase [Diaporthe amygdali]|uniref:dual specificity phosphatase n=1 Tax=Phomopsis amygdali TaxID=1214568 RepID=UPI0022FE77A0|nr:dual specificity phosphatase [Diaporthe amygdali]KAJ0120065.1 dual specificity phosphatase [Diaporthe amygdali]
MPSPPHHNLGKATPRMDSAKMPSGHHNQGIAGAKRAINNPVVGPGPPAQRQAKKPVKHSSTNSVTTSSNKPDSAASSSQKMTQITPTRQVSDPDILRRELEENYPEQTWFDSYTSLEKLRNTRGKSNNTVKILLANLSISVRDKNGAELGLYKAVQNNISHLLDVEAEWNLVTPISSQPKGCSSALWKGKLWLGGIKDSVNKNWLDGMDPVSKQKNFKNRISAVVSIHPENWLAANDWKMLFTKWDEDPTSLKPGWTEKGKRGQYVIPLEDDSSSDLLSRFEKAFKFMNYYLLQGQNVLVHCKMGQSRSASLVLGYMLTRYYKCYIADAHPSKEKALEDFNELKKIQNRFTNEISGKRKGVSTAKFEKQLEKHLENLAKYNGDQSTPAQQQKPQGKKGGGGIIKDAILLLCYMHNLTPTDEILKYWTSQKRNKHYWVRASKEKTKKEIDDEKHLAQVNDFFVGFTGKKTKT